MQHLQRYVFIQLLRPLVIACVALAVLALLTQTLSQLTLVIDKGETLLLVIRIVLLTLPQLLALVLPVALFIAVVHGLNRMHSDSELVVASTAGLSRWGVLSPVLRLTVFVMILQLALGLWLQPWGHREMRRVLHDARVEVAANLIHPGEFTRPADDLTIFVRESGPDGELRDIMIEDRRSNPEPALYLARTGRLVESATTPAILLRNGTIQTIEEDGRLSLLDFESAPFELSQFIEPPGALLYKLSDRFLFELMFPNPTDFWERANGGPMRAEGHARLSAPLYDLALALIAALALLGGDYRRTGKARRIAVAAVAALGLRVAGFAIQAGAAASPVLNGVQYVVPTFVIAVALYLYFGESRGRLRRRANAAIPRAAAAA